MIAARRDAEAIGGVALTVGSKAIELPVIIRVCPRAVIVSRFPTIQKDAVTDFLRDAEYAALIAKHATFERDKILRQGLVKIQVRGTGRAEIAHIRIVRALLVIHTLHQFRNDRVHVRIPFAMRVRRQVERHVVEKHREVRAMIQVEAAQKILVGLPPAGVLRDDDAGNGFENFAAAQNGAVGQLRRARGALGGRIRDAQQAVLAASDHHVRQPCDVRAARNPIRARGTGQGR